MAAAAVAVVATAAVASTRSFGAQLKHRNAVGALRPPSGVPVLQDGLEAGARVGVQRDAHGSLFRAGRHLDAQCMPPS